MITSCGITQLETGHFLEEVGMKGILLLAAKRDVFESYDVTCGLCHYEIVRQNLT